MLPDLDGAPLGRVHGQPGPFLHRSCQQLLADQPIAVAAAWGLPSILRLAIMSAIRWHAWPSSGLMNSATSSPLKAVSIAGVCWLVPRERKATCTVRPCMAPVVISSHGMTGRHIGHMHEHSMNDSWLQVRHVSLLTSCCSTRIVRYGMLPLVIMCMWYASLVLLASCGASNVETRDPRGHGAGSEPSLLLAKFTRMYAEGGAAALTPEALAMLAANPRGVAAASIALIRSYREAHGTTRLPSAALGRMYVLAEVNRWHCGGLTTDIICSLASAIHTADAEYVHLCGSILPYATDEIREQMLDVVAAVHIEQMAPHVLQSNIARFIRRSSVRMPESVPDALLLVKDNRLWERDIGLEYLIRTSTRLGSEQVWGLSQSIMYYDGPRPGDLSSVRADSRVMGLGVDYDRVRDEYVILGAIYMQQMDTDDSYFGGLTGLVVKVHDLEDVPTVQGSAWTNVGELIGRQSLWSYMLWELERPGSQRVRTMRVLRQVQYVLDRKGIAAGGEAFSIYWPSIAVSLGDIQRTGTEDESSIASRLLQWRPQSKK